MITEQQIEQYKELQSEKGEIEEELKRINGFLGRRSDNRDNQRAMKQDKIFVKFAGTACYLPVGIFNAELTKRKKELEKRLKEIDEEMSSL